MNPKTGAMTVRTRAGRCVWAVVACLIVSGCANDVLDPTQIGRFRPVPVVNVILENLGVADEPDSSYLGAEEPRPEDLISYEQDYRFGIGDIIRISVYELLREGFPYVNDYVVTETGRISIPDVGQVRAIGMTEKELEDEIRHILSQAILRDPSVTVILLESQSRFFSIYGAGIGRSGRFPIPRYDYRLTDGIALAGDVGQYNVSFIYISREVPIEASLPFDDTLTPYRSDFPSSVSPKPIEFQPVEPIRPPVTPEEEMIDLIRPFSASGSESDSTPPKTTGSSAAGNTGNGAFLKSGEQVDWILQEGKWIPIRRTLSGKPIPEIPSALPPASVSERDTASRNALLPLESKQTYTRVIKIPVDRLKGGDPRFDIIIRPGDRISVPVDVIGEFWVMGNVNRSGPINLTGRPMTLKMAIASAGGLNELAWPKKVEVIRRIGRNPAGLMQEETVLVDLDKIAKGLQPDFFIKQYDLVNVGTHGTSRWLAVLRNAFRATYGFGLIYDRNFADSDFGDDPLPDSFKQIF